MKLYDHVTRHPRQYNGIAYKLIIPRYYCANDACCQKVARIIPDIILPNKHYEANVIEDAVDEAVSPGDPEMFDYPCDDTVRNWKDWIAENKTQIDGALRLIGSQHPGVGLPLLDTRVSLLDHLRKNLIGWLAAVNRIIYNSGNFIPAVYPPAFSSVFDDLDIPSSHKKEDHVHILFETSPQTQLSKLINNYKTVTSRLLRKEFYDTLRPYYWKPYFWSDTYFISTVSDTTEQMIRKYIQKQGQKKNDAANPA